MLNTRPLLYVEEDSGTDRMLRTRSTFYKDGFEIPTTTRAGDDPSDDPEYMVQQNGVWQSSTLTALREKHQVEVAHKRGSRNKPKKGQILDSEKEISEEEHDSGTAAEEDSMANTGQSMRNQHSSRRTQQYDLRPRQKN
ncbi:hypothetical protein COOONC_00853 [Cooperia oncophora]